MSDNSFDANNESRSGRRRSFRGRRRALGSAVVVLVLVGLLLALLGVAGGEERIKRGVQVGGVDVGGMSRQEARQTLQKEADSELRTVSFGDGGQALSGERLGVSLDAQESVDRAWEVGRDGWFGKRALDSLRGSSAGVQVPAAVSYDEARAREAISGFASEVRQQPVDASYEVSEGGIEVASGEPGSELNVERTLANLDESLESFDGTVELATNDVQPEKTADELESNAPTKKLGEFDVPALVSLWPILPPSTAIGQPWRAWAIGVPVRASRPFLALTPVPSSRTSASRVPPLPALRLVKSTMQMRTKPSLTPKVSISSAASAPRLPSTSPPPSVACTSPSSTAVSRKTSFALLSAVAPASPPSPSTTQSTKSPTTSMASSSPTALATQPTAKTPSPSAGAVSVFRGMLCGFFAMKGRSAGVGARFNSSVNFP